MAQRERDFLERAVHPATEQAAKADDLADEAPFGCGPASLREGKCAAEGVVCLVSRSHAYVGAAARRAVEDPRPEPDCERCLHLEGFASRVRLEGVAGETRCPADLEQQRAAVSYEGDRLVRREQAAVGPSIGGVNSSSQRRWSHLRTPPPCPYRTRSGHMVLRQRFRLTP
jgi:hypothetical protein